MSQSIPTLPVPAGVSAQDFTRLVEKGKRHGSLTPDEVMRVLEQVELSHELIDSIRGGLAAEGIRFRGGTGSCRRTCSSVSRTVAPRNGGRPVSNSYRMAPSA